MAPQNVQKRNDNRGNPSSIFEYNSAEKLNQALNDESFDDKVVTICGNSLYDITDFISGHPGGTQILMFQDKKNMTETFKQVHGKSINAKRILAQYKIGQIDAKKQQESFDYLEEQAYPLREEKKLLYNDFEIDLSKGIFFQIWKLSHKQYLEVINNPVTIPFYIPIFDTKFFDLFTITPWIMIPLIWLPVALFHIYVGLTSTFPNVSMIDQYTKLGPSFSYTVFCTILLFSLFMWSVAEYSLHRYLFHMETWMPDYPIFRYLAFSIHGVHHALPMESGRLVFPIPFAIVVYYILITIMGALSPGNFGSILTGGIIIGYIYYDLTHYYLHHADPLNNFHRTLKSAHNKHHYVDHTKGYGISNKIWDYLLSTQSS